MLSEILAPELMPNTIDDESKEKDYPASGRIEIFHEILVFDDVIQLGFEIGSFSFYYCDPNLT